MRPFRLLQVQFAHFEGIQSFDRNVHVGSKGNLIATLEALETNEIAVFWEAIMWNFSIFTGSGQCV
jgi:hypothetical protein